MLNLPEKIIVFDTEYTSWEGSLERNWTNSNEYKEIIQIGAVRLTTKNMEITDNFNVLVKPVKNPRLSDFITNLTGITQVDIDTQGLNYETAIKRFCNWSEDFILYSFGRDETILDEDCNLLGISFPFEGKNFFDVRKTFQSFGIPAEKFSSGTIMEAFGVKSSKKAHNALNDVNSIG